MLALLTFLQLFELHCAVVVCVESEVCCVELRWFAFHCEFSCALHFALH